MIDHYLSIEEMNELERDPDSMLASLAAGVRADNGRVNSQASLARRFQLGVTNAMNDAGANYVLPAESLAVGLMTGPVAAIGSALGGYAVNKGVNFLSDGKYLTWGELMGDITNTPDHQFIWEFSNLGSIAGGLLGGLAGGYIPKTKAIKMKVPNPKAGQKYIAPRAKTPVFKGTRVTELSSGGGNSTVVPGRVYGGFDMGATPVYEMVPRPALVKSYPATVSKTIIPATKGHFEPSFYDTFQTHIESRLQDPITIPIPEYNTGVTYGPYLQINRATFLRKGGTMSYIDYSK